MNLKQKNALCIFIHNPEHRAAIPCIQPELSPKQALEFYNALLKDLIQDVYLSNSFDLLFFYRSSSNKEKIQSIIGKPAHLMALPDAPKMQRIEFALKTAFQQNYPKAIVLCADVPDINHIFLQDAFQQLEQHDVIIGPTLGNQLYLLGMKKLEKKILKIESPDIVQELSCHIQKSKLSYKLLKEMPIVDFPVDLQQLWARISALPGALQMHRFKHTFHVCQELFN